MVLHLGHGQWLVVDSCRDTTVTSLAAPLDYLESMGVDPGSSVVSVVATHWHDDHIRGLSEIVERCHSADFWVSAALRPTEFLTLVSAQSQAMVRSSSGLSEWEAILKILRSRRKMRPGLEVVRWAIADRVLWQRPSGMPATVISLSPSDAAISLSKHRLASHLPEVGSPKKRLASQSPNHTSVALWVEVGGIRMLLGADLEETGDEHTGWSAILKSTTRPADRASVFKIPHHGSVTAHHEEVWNLMLDPDPRAALTPWSQGGKSLPTRKDVDRITGLTPMAFATAAARKGKKAFKQRTVERTLRETTRGIRLDQPPVGHVRFRRDAAEDGSTWTHELFGAAVPLSESVQTR